jgi:C-terminal processing protease CtpA/Prc
MSLTYQDVCAVVSTIDDCLMLAEEESTQVEMDDDVMRFSRKLKCGELVVTIDGSSTGEVQYIHQRKNTASSTMAAVQTKTTEISIQENSQLISAIREIVKLDMYNAKQLAISSN